MSGPDPDDWADDAPPHSDDDAPPDEPAGPQLPAEFWAERPDQLGVLRDIAHRRTVSAPAVVLSTLCRVISHIDPDVMLPDIIGVATSANLFGVVVAPSGAGKSTSHRVAMDNTTLTVTSGIDVGHLPPGSGEGLSERFFDWVVETAKDGTKRKVKQQIWRAMHYHLDEGVALGELGNRRGSTLLSQLRTAWSGDDLGQGNASQDSFRHLPAHAYRLCFTLGIQSELAAVLLEQAAAGTPQRLIWASATDTTLNRVLDEPPAKRGAILWVTPKWEAGAVTVPAGIRQEVARHHLRRQIGRIVDDALDAHRNLNRLKLAFGFALLDRRVGIVDADWELAGMFMDYSDEVRAGVVATVAAVRRAEQQARTLRAVHTQRALDDDLEERALGRATRALARAVNRHHVEQEHDGDGCTRRCVTLAIQGKDRAVIDVDMAVKIAVGQGWVEHAAGHFVPGTVKP